MPYNFIEGYETIRGSQASCQLQDDNRIVDFFEATELTSTANVSQDEVPRIGTNEVGHKIAYITYEGSMTVYSGNPEALRILQKYIRDRKWPDITITVHVEDPDTGIGGRTVIFKHVQFSEIPIISFGADTTSMTEDLSWTADSIEVFSDFEPKRRGVISEGE